MNKFKAGILLLVSLSIMLVFPGAIGAVEVDKQLISGLPSMYSTNEFIIAHESGNPNNVGPNSLYNEVAYMKRNWPNAFVTHWVGAGGKVIQIAPTGQASWGAGSYANYRSYAQVELARTNDRATFEKDYKAYVELLKQLAKEANLPLTLDSSGKGIKSHEWVTNNLGGSDHRDPFSYLASWGVTRAQFNKDLTSEPTVAPSVNKSGTLKVTSTMAIRNSADIKATVVSTYKKGASFYYDKTINKNGVTWYSYISYSGVRRYVTEQKSITQTSSSLKWYKETGTFYPDRTINIREKPSTSSFAVGYYTAGGSVIYDSYATSGGYTWIHYKSYSGKDRYMAIRTSINGVKGPIWGYIK